MLAYGLFYWASRLSLGSFQSAFLYLGYLFLLVLFDFLVTGMCTSDVQTENTTAYPNLAGTIGFLAAYWSVRRLYSAIRVD